MNLVIMSPKYY